MNIQEVKSQKISPAARYIKESLLKSIDNYLSKVVFLSVFYPPEGRKMFKNKKPYLIRKVKK